MEHRRIGDRIIARLHRGDEILGSLRALARSEAIPSATFTGLGAVSEITLALYDTSERAYKETELKEMLEVASLTGNVSWLGDEPVVHAHGVVSRVDLTTAAGHIVRGIVSATLEVALQVHPEKVSRALDPSVGLNLLDLGGGQL